MVNMIGSYDQRAIQQRIPTIVEELQRRAAARRDYVVPRAAMKIAPSGLESDEFRLQVHGDGVKLNMPFRWRAFSQLCSTAKFSVKHVKRMVAGGHADLVANVLTEVLHRESTRKGDEHLHLVRVLDEEVDAVLSDRYSPIGNDELLAAVVSRFQGVGAELWDLRLTRDEFRILGVAPHISGEVNTDRSVKNAAGSNWFRQRWAGAEGDVVNAAVTIQGSETGARRTEASGSILRGVCCNFFLWGDRVFKVHLGGKVSSGAVEASNETRRREAELVISQIGDMVDQVFNPEKFQRMLDKLNAATERPIDKPVEAVEAAVGNLGIPVELKNSILGELLRANDMTQFGLANAVNSVASPQNRFAVEETFTADNYGLGRELNESFASSTGLPDVLANRLEDAAGQILDMGASEFRALQRVKVVA